MRSAEGHHQNRTRDALAAASTATTGDHDAEIAVDHGDAFGAEAEVDHPPHPRARITIRVVIRRDLSARSAPETPARVAPDIGRPAPAADAAWRALRPAIGVSMRLDRGWPTERIGRRKGGWSPIGSSSRFHCTHEEL